MDQPGGTVSRDGETQARRKSLFALKFLLDLIEISRGKGDVLDPLILGVVITSSVAPVGRDPRLEHSYATLDAPPPDALRRPLSVSAVARSLKLPFETVRRRVGHLVETGQLEMTPQGVLQNEAAAVHPDYLSQSLGRYERTRQLYFDMRLEGLMPEPADRQRAASLPDGPPVRIVNRVVADFILRGVDDPVENVGDRMRALILLHMMGLDEGAGPPATSMAAVAAALHLPAETVRRHVVRLERDGFVVRMGRVLTLSPSTLEGLRAHEAGAVANLGRMFTRLTHLGVLDWWDAQLAATSIRQVR